MMNSPDRTETNPFATGGERYAQARPVYPPELARSLAALTPEHDLALDVGCGSGQLTALLGPLFRQVLGVDPSGAQLAHATPHPDVTYMQGPAETFALADNTADLIVVAQAAHWFDLDPFYAEVRRVAKTHAIIALVSYGVPHVAAPVDAIFQRGYWQDTHAYWAPQREHVETGYADLYFPFSALQFPQHDCRKSMSVDQFIDYITTWSAYKNAGKSGGGDSFNRFFSQLRDAWPPEQDLEVVWPVSVRAAAVHASG